MPPSPSYHSLKLTIKVTPGAKRTEWVTASPEEPYLKLKLQAPPVDGKANEALIAFLAKTFEIPKSAIEITQGCASRIKILELKLNSEQYETVGTLLKALS